MAISPFGQTYAAASLGLSPQVTGGQDIQQILKDQLAEQAKKKAAAKNAPAPSVGNGQAALTLFGNSNG